MVQFQTPQKLLEVKNLKVYFPVARRGIHRSNAPIKAVDDVSFFINRGSTVSLSSGSDSGTTTLGRAIVHLTRSLWVLSFTKVMKLPP